MEALLTIERFYTGILSKFQIHIFTLNNYFFFFFLEQEKLKALGFNTLGIHKLGINTQELNTGKIVDAINNADISKKLSPFEKYSNAGVNMLRFLAGPDASLIDKIAEQLKLIKKGGTDSF